MKQDSLAWALGLLMALLGIWMATGKPPASNAGNLLPPAVREALWEQDQRAQNLATQERRAQRLAQAAPGESVTTIIRCVPPRGDVEPPTPASHAPQNNVLTLQSGSGLRPASRIVLSGPDWLPPRGSVIIAAHLRLFSLGTGTPDSAGPEVFENEQPWEPSRHVFPICSAAPIAFVNFPGDATGWVEIELTCRVQGWTDGEPCHGVSILPPAQGVWQFASSHYPVRRVRPHYRIEFLPPSGDEGQG
jgi:hypothetical protein